MQVLEVRLKTKISEISWKLILTRIHRKYSGAFMNHPRFDLFLPLFASFTCKIAVKNVSNFVAI